MAIALVIITANATEPVIVIIIVIVIAVVMLAWVVALFRGVELDYVEYNPR